MREELCVGVRLYKIAGRDLIIVTMFKRSIHRAVFPENTSEFSVLLQKVQPRMLEKLAGCLVMHF